jgi:hypothetical protein
MSNTATKKTLTIEIEVDGDADELQTTIAGQLTGTDAFFDDFGYGAWGGYEGPFLVACTVRDEHGKIIARREQRGKPCEVCGDFPQPTGVTTCAACQAFKDKKENNGP